MSDLKPLPCPFCGGAPRSVARPDNIDGTRFFYALACYCGGYSACAHKMAVEPTPEQAKRTAIEAWNRRAQPAQAGHVPEASCGECGKKASDGWALYCVACMEMAGLPAVTDSPPLMHSCTSSLGKTPDSTAQAGQVLTDRHTLQAQGKHPAPCARFCEANAFRIEERQQARLIAELEAQVKALSLDAGRYRQIRRGQKWSVIDGIGDQLRGESLDAAFDTAIAAGKGEG